MHKEKNDLPLLLLDNSTMNVLSTGWFRIDKMSFEDAKYLIESYDSKDILCCYSDRVIDTVIHDYLGIEKRDFTFKKIRKMRPGQMAIVFKFYTEGSASQPVIEPEPGIQAKKIQNVYIYCECISNVDSVIQSLIESVKGKNQPNFPGDLLKG
ncbi:MAG: hypothetical protein VB118_10630 [Oscillospiraceae bacterium]|nr:hypothetical protein [Oscillospiraceae bacterium]